MNNETTYHKFWLSLDSELCVQDGVDIIGTKNPTNHSILIEIRVENIQIENNVINFDDDLANNINSIINNFLTLNDNNESSYNIENILNQNQHEEVFFLLLKFKNRLIKST
jgi:hypothetical protein